MLVLRLIFYPRAAFWRPVATRPTFRQKDMRYPDERNPIESARSPLRTTIFRRAIESVHAVSSSLKASLERLVSWPITTYRRIIEESFARVTAVLLFDSWREN